MNLEQLMNPKFMIFEEALSKVYSILSKTVMASPGRRLSCSNEKDGAVRVQRNLATNILHLSTNKNFKLSTTPLLYDNKRCMLMLLLLILRMYAYI
ncbi:hypothetical protein GQX74_015529 [Glossina fuscipes]|nr:hypothetical protein GQX74_015529 [Glossina fuscipes]